MKELVMLIRPEKLEDIKKRTRIIEDTTIVISGDHPTMDVDYCIKVMGCGTQKGISSDDAETVNELKGFKTTINLLPKVKVEVVVEDRFVEQIVEKVMEVCATDHVGDGKIFIKDVLDAVRIRTGERGTKAL